MRQKRIKTREKKSVHFQEHYAPYVRFNARLSESHIQARKEAKTH